jgi:hypothetical protein
MSRPLTRRPAHLSAGTLWTESEASGKGAQRVCLRFRDSDVAKFGCEQPNLGRL